MIRAVLFDFGGVIAEEGFHRGMKALAEAQGFDPKRFFAIAEFVIHDIGYVTGRSDEPAFWKALKSATGLRGDDADLREAVLSRFVLRHGVLGLADRLRKSGIFAGILSDQTDWLAELDRRTPFFARFDRVLNSFHLGKSKRDPSLFPEACAMIGFRPEEVLFVDDTLDHIRRAETAGLHVLHCAETEVCVAGVEELVGIERPSR
ncbi:MAG: hypothetical protein OHK006_07740 [Thermodesulfovibrionales bacterium]